MLINSKQRLVKKKKFGNNLFSPSELNTSFHTEFYKRKWEESRYNYYITFKSRTNGKSVSMSSKDQKEFLVKR